MKEIYTNSYVSQWHVSQLGLPTTSVLAGPKLAVFHVPFPYDTQDAEFEILVDQALETADKIIILCSELHDRTVDFVRRYQQHKIYRRNSYIYSIATSCSIGIQAHITCRSGC
jgi:hypothetical protein